MEKMSIEEATSYAVLAMFQAGITKKQALKVVKLMCDNYELRRPDQVIDLAVGIMAEGTWKS